MRQAKKDKRRLDRRSRRITVGPAAAKIVARATAHRVVDGCEEYVPLTDSQRMFEDSGTWNFARDVGYARR